MSNESDLWFNLFTSRVSNYTIWTLLVSFSWLLCACCLSLSLQMPLQITSAIYATFHLMISPSSLFYVFLFVVSVTIGAVKHSQEYTVTPTPFYSWSRVTISCLQPAIASSLGQCCLKSALSAWCLLKLVWPEYGSLVITCHENEDAWIMTKV